MNGYKIVLLKAIFMLYKLPESERVCSGICNQRLELFFRTKDYIIRIDKLDEETMRYASWKSTQQMSDTPELVLNGSYVEKDNTFLFSKGSYRYVVTMGDKATLKVQYNGKTILQQTQETKEF